MNEIKFNKPRYKLYHKDGYTYEYAYTYEEAILNQKIYNDLYKDEDEKLVIYDTLTKTIVK